MQLPVHSCVLVEHGSAGRVSHSGLVLLLLWRPESRFIHLVLLEEDKNKEYDLFHISTWERAQRKHLKGEGPVKKLEM